MSEPHRHPFAWQKTILMVEDELLIAIAQAGPLKKMDYRVVISRKPSVTAWCRSWRVRPAASGASRQGSGH